MDREQFGTALDELIQAYDRKVCAEIDAGNCRTPRDWKKAHEAEDAYLGARDAFVAEVFAALFATPKPRQSGKSV